MEMFVKCWNNDLVSWDVNYMNLFNTNTILVSWGTCKWHVALAKCEMQLHSYTKQSSKLLLDSPILSKTLVIQYPMLWNFDNLLVAVEGYFVCLLFINQAEKLTGPWTPFLMLLQKDLFMSSSFIMHSVST